ncbi:MAG: tetratricopeptide repeat-containing protein, partial [Nitrosospira sp.]
MKLSRFSLILVLTVFGAQTHAITEWNSLNEEVGLLYQQGDYNRATTVAKKALQTAEQSLDPSHPDVATSLNSLALLYTAQGQYTQAEPLLKRALAIFEKSGGAEGPEMAASLNNLAVLYRNQKQYTLAEPL